MAYILATSHAPGPQGLSTEYHCSGLPLFTNPRIKGSYVRKLSSIFGCSFASSHWESLFQPYVSATVSDTLGENQTIPLTSQLGMRSPTRSFSLLPVDVIYYMQIIAASVFDPPPLRTTTCGPSTCRCRFNTFRLPTLSFEPHTEAFGSPGKSLNTGYMCSLVHLPSDKRNVHVDMYIRAASTPQHVLYLLRHGSFLFAITSIIDHLSSSTNFLFQRIQLLLLQVDQCA